ncbi:28873_t:CDS:2 [Dentiscutata erythropus]|uniref:28873_t:CDS:1 n=1 Tax=Dentiscutata erythropus TaxID=1348616 RepID=A0A9N9I7X0_9GLOM|nr:28873_t:CDS:2 [Dentiscutata erythropus]
MNESITQYLKLGLCSRQDAYNILSQILNNKNWEVKHYSQGQQIAVILVTSQAISIDKLESNSSAKNYKKDNQKQYYKKLLNLNWQFNGYVDKLKM